MGMRRGASLRSRLRAWSRSIYTTSASAAKEDSAASVPMFIRAALVGRAPGGGHPCLRIQRAPASRETTLDRQAPHWPARQARAYLLALLLGRRSGRDRRVVHPVFGWTEGVEGAVCLVRVSGSI